MMVKNVFTTDEIVMNSVLSALRYYSVFQYPLKAGEVYGSLPIACSLSSLLVALEDLDVAGKIYKYDGYYSLSADVRKQVLRRREANNLAEVKKGEAIKVGKFLSKFPFVRFVGLSGSLSKGYADYKSDFDFFIVTAENRLWICRTILHLFKKVTFLAGQQHKFCMNYFADTHDLEIEEKNRFTAIELASLIPASGFYTYVQLEEANKWTKRFLPNGYVGFSNVPGVIHDSNPPLRAALEFVINKLLPEKLNRSLMKITDAKWRKKWAKKDFPMEEYDLAFKTTLHVSKNHPKNHQKRVLNAISKFDD
jgi:hypothetical protein